MSGRRPLTLGSAERKALATLDGRPGGLTEQGFAAFGVKLHTLKALQRRKLLTTTQGMNGPIFKITQSGKDALPLRP